MEPQGFLGIACFPVLHGIFVVRRKYFCFFFSKRARGFLLTLKFCGKEAQKSELKAKVSPACGSDKLSSFVRRRPIFGRRWIVGKLREPHRIGTSGVMGGQQLRRRKNACVPRASSNR